LPFGAFSSWKVPGRFRAGEPTYRFSQRYSPPSEDAGPARWVAVPGLWPFRESLAIKRVFSPLNAGCSLGLCPSRAFLPKALSRISPELLSRAWLGWSRWPPQAAPQSIHRPWLGSVVRRYKNRFGRDSPSRVFAPAWSRSFEPLPPPSYAFTSRGNRHYCR
jgi:hypothetical protein